MFAPESVVQEFKKDPAATAMVAALAAAGQYAITDVAPGNEAAAYNTVVAAQAKFEQAIVDGLKSGDIANAVAVIHTGECPTPLSRKVNARTPILEEFLAAGGTLVCVYQQGKGANSPSDPDGRYAAYVTQCQNLLDFPVTDPDGDLTKDMSGASYAVKTKDGRNFFYSFTSFQVHTVGQSGTRPEWAVYADEVGVISSSETVFKRAGIVDSFLKARTGLTMEEFASATRPTDPQNSGPTPQGGIPDGPA